VYFVQYAYRDEVVSVFVRFLAPLMKSIEF
jgi:hypothetical protein